MTPESIQPGFFTLRTLASYASCSVRWLRARLVDAYDPLPHFKIGGKVLVKREDFDQWINTHRVVRRADDLKELVETVVAQVRPRKRVA